MLTFTLIHQNAMGRTLSKAGSLAKPHAIHFVLTYFDLWQIWIGSKYAKDTM